MHRTKTRRLISLWLLILLSACQPQQQRYQQQFLQFGTLIDITLVSADEARVRQTFERIEALLKQRHRQWHGWQDGALKRFNDALSSGQSVKIPPILHQLIIDSKKYFALSDGRFNPALGKLIAAWGFHASQQPDRTLIRAIQQNLPTMDDLLVDGDSARSRNPNLQLDFGAIAKGLAIRHIADLIRQQNIDSFIINAGGDIYADAHRLESGWRIAIENPFFKQKHAQRIIGSITLKQPQSIFTSGNYRRFAVDDNGLKRHHIIDSKTGAPSRNISSVTVLTADPVLADVAATSLMLTPPDELAAMSKKLGISDFLVITEQHQAYLSQTMQQRIEWIENSALTPHIVKQITGEPSHK
jgi:thiamine biosynthesis lipoprotein